MVGDKLFELPSALPERTARDNGTNAWGALSELKAMTRLVELGHKIAVPLVDDDGVDFVVDYRTTVQVKSRGVPNRDTYSFSLPGSRGRYRVDGSWYTRPTLAFADVFIFHGRQNDVWWIATRQLMAECGITETSTAISLSFTGSGYKHSSLSVLAFENWAAFE